MVTSGSYGACEGCVRNYDGGCPYGYDDNVQFDGDGICKFFTPFKLKKRRFKKR